MRQPFFGIRRSSLNRDESGQVLVIGAFIALALAMVSITVANVGMTVAEKIHLQDTADASAYSAAVVEARYMNLVAYINRAMVANYDMMAFNTALWATVAAHDHASAVVTSILYKISFIVEIVSLGLATHISIKVDRLADAFRDFLHSPMHDLNQKLDKWFSQDGDNYNKYFDIYNANLLAMYQGLLYAAAQSSRHEIMKEVAQKMDPEVMMTTTLAVGGEAVSYDDLAQAVDYASVRPRDRGGLFGTLGDRFNRMAGRSGDANQPYYLGAITEASLDKFAAGRYRDGTPLWFLRQFNVGDIIHPIVRPLERFLHVTCKIASLGRKKCRYSIDLDIGSNVRDSQEDRADQWHVPFIATQRMREVNAWSMSLRIQGFGAGFINWALGQTGYTSGHRLNDVANSANATASLEYGWPDCSLTSWFGYWGWWMRWYIMWLVQYYQTYYGYIPSWLQWWLRWLGGGDSRCDQSILAGTWTWNPAMIPQRGLNAINMQLAMFQGVTLPIFCDDHWDGTYDSKPVSMFEIWPPGPGQIQALRYAWDVYSNRATEEGVPGYDWEVDLDDIGYYRYHYPRGGAKKRPWGNSRGYFDNPLTGPSVASVAVKKAEEINGLHGLGIGNDYDLKAISRAQVYYLKNPHRPYERPSMFNPHWAARLAPLDSHDTPALLQNGLPYVSSMGLPVKATR